MKNSIRQIWAVARVAARSNLAYLGEVASRTFFLAVILFIFLKLWQATYRESASAVIGGLSLNQMLWYLTVTEAIYMSAPRLAQQIDEDVRSGALAVRLLKPISYPLYCLSSALGERIVRFLANFATGAAVTFCLVGPFNCSPAAPIMLLVAVLLAFVLDGLGHLIIGLWAFWLEDTSGLLLIYTRLSMILGGMLIPMELFPDWLKSFVFFLPFPYLVWGPAHLFVHSDWLQFVQLVGLQSLYILLLLAVVNLIYGWALERISAHGG
jgi:ABC-2 type transport system permease protein